MFSLQERNQDIIFMHWFQQLWQLRHTPQMLSAIGW